jgi:hypothetical protein
VATIPSSRLRMMSGSLGLAYGVFTEIEVPPAAERLTIRFPITETGRGRFRTELHLQLRLKARKR